MKRIVLSMLTAVAVAAFAGCMNMYNRAPWTRGRIERMYQSSREAAGMAIVVSFPQMMCDTGSGGLIVENILTVPFLGLPCAVDAVCEAAIDTVLLPIDWPLSAARKKPETELERRGR